MPILYLYYAYYAYLEQLPCFLPQICRVANSRIKNWRKGLEKAKAEQLVAMFVQNKLDVIIKRINSRITH